MVDDYSECIRQLRILATEVRRNGRRIDKLTRLVARVANVVGKANRTSHHQSINERRIRHHAQPHIPHRVHPPSIRQPRHRRKIERKTTKEHKRQPENVEPANEKPNNDKF